MTTMRTLVTLSFLLFGFAIVGAQDISPWSPRTGFALTLAGGVTGGSDENIGVREAGQLGLEYRMPLAGRFSLVYGTGIQFRRVRATMMEEVPNDVIIGQFPVNYRESEFYELPQLEAYAQLGIGVRAGRLDFGAAILPAWRVNDRIRYRYFQEFGNPARPATDVDVVVSSGDEVANYTGFTGTRKLRYSDNFSLQAAFSANYNVTGRLAVGLIAQPLLTHYALEQYDYTVCGIVGCGVTSVPLTVFEARTTSWLLRVRYAL